MKYYPTESSHRFCPLPTPKTKRSLFIFTLLVFLVSSGTGPGHLAGQATSGGNVTEEKKYTEQECHKKFAVELNNLVWKLLGKKERTKEEDEKMINAAHASLYHWSIVGTEVNVQRGEWLLSHVYAVLNLPEPSLHYAGLCMALTEAHNLVDFDLAYAYEAMARANAVAGKKSECEKFMLKAEEAGEKIKEKEDKELFFSDFKTGPWYGMK